MGSIRRNELEERLKFILGGRTNVDTELTRWVKDAYREFCVQRRPMLRQSFVRDLNLVLASGASSLSTASLTFTPHSVAILRIVDPDVSLTYVAPQDWSRFSRDTSGVPTHYSYFGANLYFYPKAGAEYSLDILWRRYQAELSAATTQIAIDDAWVRPLLSLAASFALDDLGEEKRSANYYAKMQVQVDAILSGLEGDRTADNGGIGVIVEDS